MKTVHSVPGSTVSSTNRHERAAIVPVVTINKDRIVPEILARETEVIRRNIAVGVEEAVVLGGDVLVITDLLAGSATEILAEATQTSVPLFEDDSLSFNFADGFGDNPSRCVQGMSVGLLGRGRKKDRLFGHFLDDEKALLDDFD